MDGPVRIRMATPDDAAVVRAIYAPFVETTAVTFESEVPPVEEMATRIRTTLPRYPWLAAERDGAVVGYAYAASWRSRAAYRWAVETTVYLRDDARGQGVGRAIYRTLLACIRLQGFRLALAGITLPNPASVGLHEGFGFRAVSVYRACGHKLGAWHDVGMWEIELAPRTDVNPAEPLDVATARARPEWAAAFSS
jgi:phosphinothricin acetyltransferase